MSNILIIIGLLGFTALMWWLSDIWEKQSDKTAERNTRIEREKHDMQTAILKAHHRKGLK